MEMMIEPGLQSSLPIIAKTALAKMDTEQQGMFAEDYKKKKKSVGTAYLLMLFIPAMFYYVGKPGLCWLFIFVSLISIGVGGWIWFFVELFLIPKRVRSYNEDLAVKILRDQKLLSAA